MTSSGWLAIGAILAALAASWVEPRVLVLAAAGLAIAGFSSRGIPNTPAARVSAQATLPLALGAAAIAMRLLVWPASEPALAQLPDGRGPWPALVESLSPVRDGQQVAMLRVVSTGDVRVAATLPRYPAIQPGDAVTVDGAIEPPPEGPYGEYLCRIGVAGTLRSRTLLLRPTAETGPPSLERLRRAAGDALAAALPEPEAGLAAGIVIGLRDRVDRDLAADFTTVGASHIVAISGWNVAIVAASVAAVVGRIGRRRRAIVLTLAIVAYVVFAGASASVVRAAAMAGVVLLARETGRAGRAAAALGWAATLLLMADPTLIGDAGFQLSSLATAGILAWASPLARWFERAGRGHVPGWLAESLAVSLAAQAATLPIVLLTFGRLAIVSPVVNLAVVPLVAPAMAACLLALLAGGAAMLGAPGAVATLAGLPAWALLTAICTVIRAAAQLPIASVTLAPPWTGVSAAVAVGLPALIVVTARKRRHRSPKSSAASPPVASTRPVSSSRAGGSPAGPGSARLARLTVAAVAASVIGLGLVIAHRPIGAARITVLDVGQGDAILVEGGRGARLLVDGGPDPDRLLVELDRRLPPWDRRIDMLVLSHPHEDHVAGLPLLLDRYRVSRIFETGMRGPGPGYAAFAQRLAGPVPPHAVLATGAHIGLDDIDLRILWPDPGRVPLVPPDNGRGINDVSVVLLGAVAGRRFLLTGDVEDDIDPILEARGLPPIDILKVAHHGSRTASTPAFLGIVHPSLAIVSAGAGNPYGHPAKSTIEHLEEAGARVLRTDTDGSVEMTIGTSGQIEVRTSGARRVALAPVLAQVAVAPPLLGLPAHRFSCGIPSGE